MTKESSRFARDEINCKIKSVIDEVTAEEDEPKDRIVDTHNFGCSRHIRSRSRG